MARAPILLAVLAGLAVGAVAFLAVDSTASRQAPATSTTTASTSTTPAPAPPPTTEPSRAARETPEGLYQPPSPVEAAPAPTGPITDPQAAAVVYLVAAETVTADEAGRRRRVPGMAPDNPEATTGVLVTDAPPPGLTRTVEVLEVRQWARSQDRIAYRITHQHHLDDGAGAVTPDGPPHVTYVVVSRQPDGGWLVSQHVPELDPAD